MSTMQARILLTLRQYGEMTLTQLATQLGKRTFHIHKDVVKFIEVGIIEFTSERTLKIKDASVRDS